MDFFPDGGQSNAKGCEKLIEIKDEDDTENQERRKRFLRGGNNNEQEDDNDIPKKNFIQRLRDRIGRISPLKKVFLNVHGYIGCNHLRSPHYFISSINQCDFRAKLCSSWSNYQSKKCKDPVDNNLTYPRMGFRADRSDRVYRQGNGSFYLKTISEKPYCSLPTPPSNVKSKKQTPKNKKRTG